jgi:hypothetical protein
MCNCISFLDLVGCWNSIWSQTTNIKNLHGSLDDISTDIENIFNHDTHFYTTTNEKNIYYDIKQEKKVYLIIYNIQNIKNIIT